MVSKNPNSRNQKGKNDKNAVKNSDKSLKVDESQESRKSISYKGITTRDARYSESYDEYLECIYRLSLINPAGWVKNSQIAKRLKVKAPSVTNMLGKLTEAKLIVWKPRSGIRLTEMGRERAKEIVFYHSIIEIFLSQILGMTNPDKINQIACDFEHHLTKEFSDRLIDLLGIPKELKNVNNFILNDSIPAHIETRPIYSEKQLLSILEQFHHRLQKRGEEGPLSLTILEEEYQAFTAELQEH